MSAPDMTGERYNAWVASVGEAGWHAIAASASGGSLMAACGHRVYGPVHRRLGPVPPEDALRSACAACLHAIGYVTPRPRWALRGHQDEVPEWPVVDPDDPAQQPTTRRPVLQAAMFVAAPAPEHERQLTPGWVPDTPIELSRFVHGEGSGLLQNGVVHV